MKKTVVLLAATLFAGSANAVPVDFVVDALANDYPSALDTGISFSAGDTINASVDPNDLWSAGALPRWSDANGLDGDLLATGSDESGQAAGVLIGRDFGLYTFDGLSAPFGSLVGKLGSTLFVLGTSFNGPAPDSGNLLLFYWDSGGSDNANSITVTIDNGINGNVPAPTTLALLGLGLAGMGYRRRRQLKTA